MTLYHEQPPLTPAMNSSIAIFRGYVALKKSRIVLYFTTSTLLRLADKRSSEDGRALCRLRQQTVEPVFGIIKVVLGFTRFSAQSQDKVANRWCLVALAYNGKGLHKLQLEIA